MAMSWILDGITAAVLAVFVLIGVKSGFIKSVVRLVGFAAAVIAAAIASTPVAQYLYDTLLSDKVEQLVNEQVSQGVAAAATTVQEQITQVISSLPALVQNMLSVNHVVIDPASTAAVSADELTTIIATDFLQPVCVALLQVLVFLILFLVLFIVVKLLGGVIDKIFASLPVIKQVNGLLGGVIGLIEGVLIVFVLCVCLELYMTMTGGDSLITTADLESTYILKFMREINPVL